jgi:hypothetical protein
MSILQIVETSPGRVRGIVRLIVGHARQRLPEGELKALMSPPGLPLRSAAGHDDEEDGVTPRGAGGRAGGPSMIDKVVGACEKVGLVCREDGNVSLNPALPAAARDPKTADQRLPLTMSELICDPKREENRRLAQLIAWYLTLDPLNAPGDEKSVTAAHQKNPALQQHFEINNLSYGQFEDWIVYLGFAWAGLGLNKTRSIFPDPTAYLRRSSLTLFDSQSQGEIAAAELVRRLALMCPVLDGGAHRLEINRIVGGVEQEGHLSPAASQAWLRLQREGFWKLEHQSDAGNAVVVVDGGRTMQVAIVKRQGPSTFRA